MEEQVISKAINGWDYQNNDRSVYTIIYGYETSLELDPKLSVGFDFRQSPDSLLHC